MFTFIEQSAAVGECDVLIVGAGPTGLTLAAGLRRLGHAPLILDRQEEGANTSRAAVVHARTLEVLEPLGIVPRMLEEGIHVPTFRVRDGSRTLMSVSFADLPTRFPFTLMYPQNRTEALLLSVLNDAGGAVQRPCEVSTIQADGARPNVVYKQGGQLRSVRARWVVGCDGSHSVVRQQAGISFAGSAYDESFILADVEMEWPLGREEVNLFFSPEGLVVVAPLPENRFRIVATVAEASEVPTQAEFQQILDRRCSAAGGGSIRQTVWTSRFRVSHRSAQQMRKGSVLLAGDAAHVHSPAGGQGMNTGIQDAMSLAEALHTHLQAGDERALDMWQEERLQVAHSVVRLTDRMTKVATISSSPGRALRNALLGLIGHVPGVQDLLAETLSELKYR